MCVLVSFWFLLGFLFCLSGARLAFLSFFSSSVMDAVEEREREKERERENPEFVFGSSRVPVSEFFWGIV